MISIHREIHHKELRTGYTTGACATAAAKGAALMLIHQLTVSEVTIELPAGVSATFRLYGQTYSTNTASCFVIKDAGDDPDVTNGAEVHVTVCRFRDPLTVNGRIDISGGEGIGKVTKPGLAVSPGNWAINPVPRMMIESVVGSVVFPASDSRSRLSDTIFVTVSIPDGEERAIKTLNKRLGIIGGLSILGTTGIVRPISAKAWTDTIDSALDVAKACECETVILSTGRTSELAAQNFLNHKIDDFSDASNHIDKMTSRGDISSTIQDEGFIMMGDHIAYTLRACHVRGFNQPIITCQFAKLLKIACGHENTHAAVSSIDMTRLHKWVQNSDISHSILAVISKANTAREIAIQCCFDQKLINLILQHACSEIRKYSCNISPQFLVADYNGNCIFNSHP